MWPSLHHLTHTEKLEAWTEVKIAQFGIFRLRRQFVLYPLKEIDEGSEVLEGVDIPIDDFLLD